MVPRPTVAMSMLYLRVIDELQLPGNLKQGPSSYHYTLLSSLRSFRSAVNPSEFTCHIVSLHQLSRSRRPFFDGLSEPFPIPFVNRVCEKSRK